LMHDTTKAERLLAGLLDRIVARGYELGPLAHANPATARGGDHTFGRRDGKRPCGR